MTEYITFHKYTTNSIIIKHINTKQDKQPTLMTQVKKLKNEISVFFFGKTKKKPHICQLKKECKQTTLKQSNYIIFY